MRKFSPFLLSLSEQRYTRVLLRNVLVTQFIYPNLCFFVFLIVHNFFYPHFLIRIRHPRVSSPRFVDTFFASRFFELFTFSASLKLNTQRRSAPSMHALRRWTERSYLQNCANYWHHVLYVSEGSNHVTATWKKDFFPLFVCFFIIFFFAIRISRFFSSYFFCYPHFFPSAFFYPHFTIRRYPVRILQTPICLMIWRFVPRSCLAFSIIPRLIQSRRCHCLRLKDVLKFQASSCSAG